MTEQMPDYVRLWSWATGQGAMICHRSDWCEGWLIIPSDKTLLSPPHHDHSSSEVPAFDSADWAWQVVTGLVAKGIDVHFDDDGCVFLREGLYTASDKSLNDALLAAGLEAMKEATHDPAK